MKNKIISKYHESIRIKVLLISLRHIEKWSIWMKNTKALFFIYSLRYDEPRRTSDRRAYQSLINTNRRGSNDNRCHYGPKTLKEDKQRKTLY